MTTFKARPLGLAPTEPPICRRSAGAKDRSATPPVLASSGLDQQRKEPFISWALAPVARSTRPVSLTEVESGEPINMAEAPSAGAATRNRDLWPWPRSPPRVAHHRTAANSG